MHAAIDIGSNSIRLAMSNGTTQSVITQLADGLRSTGKLSPNGVKNSIAALIEFKKICGDVKCEKITAFATEAVRCAVDGNEFINTVKAKTGLTVIVLSQRQEAAVALFGATKPSGAVTVCDLGGGSMEVISSPDGKTPAYIKSLPLGVVSLKNRFDGDYRKAIDDMPEIIKEYGDIPKYPTVISGGSACAIAAAILNLKVYDSRAVSTRFSAKQLDDIMPILLCKRLSVYRPICAKRADTVPFGAIAIQALINHIGVTEFYVSDAGNLEAILNGFEL